MYSVFVIILTKNNKNHVMTVRLSDIEYDSICNLAQLKDISKAEVLRRMYWTVRAIFSDDAFLEQIDLNPQLLNALKGTHDQLDCLIKYNKKNND